MNRLLHTVLLTLWALLMAGQGVHASEIISKSVRSNVSEISSSHHTDEAYYHATSTSHHRHGEHHDQTIVEKEEEETRESSHKKITAGSNYISILCIVLILGHVFNDEVISTNTHELFHSLAPNKRYILTQVFRI